MILHWREYSSRNVAARLDRDRAGGAALQRVARTPRHRPRITRVDREGHHRLAALDQITSAARARASSVLERLSLSL